MVHILICRRVQGLRQLANVPHVYLILVRLFGPLDVVIERVGLLNSVQNALVEQTEWTHERTKQQNEPCHMHCAYCAVSWEQSRAPGSMPPYMHSAATRLVDCFHSTAKNGGCRISWGFGQARCDDLFQGYPVCVSRWVYCAVASREILKYCMYIVIRSATPALNALYLIFSSDFM